MRATPLMYVMFVTAILWRRCIEPILNCTKKTVTLTVRVNEALLFAVLENFLLVVLVKWWQCGFCRRKFWDRDRGQWDLLSVVFVIIKWWAHGGWGGKLCQFAFVSSVLSVMSVLVILWRRWRILWWRQRISGEDEGFFLCFFIFAKNPSPLPQCLTNVYLAY